MIPPLLRQELTHAAPGRPSAITVGVFDGVHRGHLHLIQQVRRAADELELACGVITLHPHPQTVLRPDQPLRYISSLEDRLDLLAASPADWVGHVTFTSEVAQLTAREFVQALWEGAGLRCLVVGPDFALGRDREGDRERLRQLGLEFGYSLCTAAPLVEDGEVVSSTAVRNALQAGEMERVSQLLGRPFSLHGPVLRGAERGHRLGFPTANIGVAPDRALPPFGVYVTWAYVGEAAYPAVTNIGLRPTFGEQTPTVESHLLGFAGDLYSAELRIELLHRLRPEMRFSGPEELKTQIARDIEATRRVLGQRHRRRSRR